MVPAPALIVPRPWLISITPSPAWITHLPAKMLGNKVAPNVVANILRNPPFFNSTTTVSLTPLN